MTRSFSASELKEIPFFFIVGRGRSGTTLLQTMLDANPSVIVPFESKLIIHLRRDYAELKKWDRTLVERFLSDLSTEIYYSKYWKNDEAALRSAISAIPPEELSFSILCKLVYLSFPSAYPNNKVSIIGDKNPVYSIFIRELEEIFPEAKFIHLVRDPRDNVLSFKKVFKKDGGLAVLAKGWKMYNERIEEAKVPEGKKFLTLKYEDLVEDPEKMLRKVCDFLCVPFDNAMLEYQSGLKEEKNKLVGKVMEELHPNLAGPVTTGYVGQWKQELSRREISLIEGMVGAAAERYGYHPTEVRKQFFLRAVSATMRNRLQIGITRSYYRRSLRLRKYIRKISNALYRWFGYSNIYNQEDFRFRE